MKWHKLFDVLVWMKLSLLYFIANLSDDIPNYTHGITHPSKVTKCYQLEYELLINCTIFSKYVGYQNKVQPRHSSIELNLITWLHKLLRGYELEMKCILNMLGISGEHIWNQIAHIIFFYYFHIWMYMTSIMIRIAWKMKSRVVPVWRYYGVYVFIFWIKLQNSRCWHLCCQYIESY